MGFDHHVCETGLKLGLGFSPAVKIIPAKAGNHNQLSRPKAVALSFEPSLTLGLVTADKVNDSFINKPSSVEILYRQDSTGASSFSNASVKREREQLGSEETETTARARIISDEDDDGSNGRKKLRLTKAQSALLEESFKQHSTLNPKQKQELARELNLRPRQVEVWFQNRRARTKLKQTEVDCEYLKKCCETLTDENRRLQKEVQELKALKVAQPLYMQLPAATLTMCPSCERVGGSAPTVATTDTSSKEPFSSVSAPKPHFYNSFPNPSSAAC
ncbi:homeobox-leucine zipper protein HAT22-like isoform X2 [Apium graveolens]|uniref:homeobox-leucine zipper protein HAT22-like isoform X2 n=1 Tax=Apium graveolens TaxID=4045 RepID=UPI003D78DF7E